MKLIPFHAPEEAPRQGVYTTEVFVEFMKGLEALDGSPLLDIKPHAPELDYPF